MTGSTPPSTPDRPLVRIDRRGRVAWVVIDRPEVHNSVSTATNAALVHALAEVDGDSSVGCVVLRGAGDRAFCSGADLREVTGKQPEQYREEFQTIVDTLVALRRLEKPVIAAVRGYALGGGLGLTAACDIVLAGDDAVFGTPEITIGRFPFIISVAIQRAVGPKAMAELAFAGERFDAHRGREIGLVNRVVPAEQLWDEVDALAQRIASFSPRVLAMGKQALATTEDLEFSAALDQMRDALTENATMPDSVEGVSAFLEKRDPVWRS